MTSYQITLTQNRYKVHPQGRQFFSWNAGYRLPSRWQTVKLIQVWRWMAWRHKTDLVIVSLFARTFRTACISFIFNEFNIKQCFHWKLGSLSALSTRKCRFYHLKWFILSTLSTLLALLSALKGIHLSVWSSAQFDRLARMRFQDARFEICRFGLQALEIIALSCLAVLLRSLIWPVRPPSKRTKLSESSGNPESVCQRCSCCH